MRTQLSAHAGRNMHGQTACLWAAAQCTFESGLSSYPSLPSQETGMICMFLITFIVCCMFLITFILCCHFSALGRDNTAEVLKHYPPAHVSSSVCCVCWRGLSLSGTANKVCNVCGDRPCRALPKVCGGQERQGLVPSRCVFPSRACWVKARSPMWCGTAI